MQRNGTPAAGFCKKIPFSLKDYFIFFNFSLDRHKGLCYDIHRIACPNYTYPYFGARAENFIGTTSNE